MWCLQNLINPLKNPKIDVPKPTVETPKPVTEVPKTIVDVPKTNAPQPTTTPTKKVELRIIWDGIRPNAKLDIDNEDYVLNVIVLTNQTLSLKNLTILHDGIEKRVDGAKMDEISLDADVSGEYRFKFKLKLHPDLNRLSVKVKEGENEDKTIEIKVNYRPADKGTLYVLCVGVPDATGRLLYTQKDARDFAQVFKDKMGKKDVVVTTLTSRDSTTAESISGQINELVNIATRPNDAIVLYFSTHGIIGDNNELRLLGSTYKVHNKEFTSIDFRANIIQKLQKLPCSKYLFIDACKSGSVNDAKEVTEAFKNTVQSNSFYAIMSCSGNESSYEDAKWQNGAFTKIFIDIVTNPKTCKALDGKNGDAADGVLSLTELFPYLQKGVQDLVKNGRNEKQTPLLMMPLQAEKKPIFDF